MCSLASLDQFDSDHGFMRLWINCNGMKTLLSRQIMMMLNQWCFEKCQQQPWNQTQLNFISLDGKSSVGPGIRYLMILGWILMQDWLMCPWADASRWLRWSKSSAGQAAANSSPRFDELAEEYRDAKKWESLGIPARKCPNEIGKSWGKSCGNTYLIGFSNGFAMVFQWFSHSTWGFNGKMINGKCSAMIGWRRAHRLNLCSHRKLRSIPAVPGTMWESNMQWKIKA